jgi:phage/conjugal plasmid C-4 type zinc finger TraR family protein
MSDQATASAIEEVLRVDREAEAHAAERMAQGGYGRCELCGREIGEERLKALPSATRCISCQALWEQGDHD